MGIQPTTSGLDLPLLYRLSYEVGEKVGDDLGCESRRRESKGTYATRHNIHILPGPDQTSQLVGVLSRFRRESVGVLADIQGIFLIKCWWNPRIVMCLDFCGGLTEIYLEKLRSIEWLRIGWGHIVTQYC